jgi:hypothetical protein
VAAARDLRRRLALLSVVVGAPSSRVPAGRRDRRGPPDRRLYDVVVVIAAGVFVLVYALATFAIIRYRVLRRRDRGRSPAGRGNDLIESDLDGESRC